MVELPKEMPITFYTGHWQVVAKNPDDPRLDRLGTMTEEEYIELFGDETKTIYVPVKYSEGSNG